jgi:hypothetical protein
MSFPKKGNLFPAGLSADRGCDPNVGSRNFAAEISSALNDAFGKTPAHIKIVATWTGANERTVKNWFAGNYGPSGEHLITLIKHSDAVLGVVLSMADRRQLLISSKIDEIEKRLTELADFIRSQRQEHGSGKE